MARDFNKPSPAGKRRIQLQFGLTGAVVAALVLTTAPATAQSAVYMDTGSPHVTVDLSVIDDGGVGASGAGVSPRYRGGRRLLMPGPRPPVSRFHAPPGSNLKDVPAAPAPKAARMTPPAAPRVVVKAPPAPAASEPPAPPKSPPAPVAKSEAPPPPQPAKTAAAPPAAPPPPPAPAKTEVKAAAAPAPAAPQMEEKASLPPAGDSSGARIVFAAEASKIPDASKASLRGLAASIKGKDGLRLQLLAYAGGKSLSASKARRLSLSRALSVRSYLTEVGVRGNRIDVRALGNKVSDEPMNRVDVVVVER